MAWGAWLVVWCLTTSSPGGPIRFLPATALPARSFTPCYTMHGYDAWKIPQSDPAPVQHQKARRKLRLLLFLVGLHLLFIVNRSHQLLSLPLCRASQSAKSRWGERTGGLCRIGGPGTVDWWDPAVESPSPFRPRRIITQRRRNSEEAERPYGLISYLSFLHPPPEFSVIKQEKF